MSNILIVNGAKQFAHSNGELNDTLTALGEDVLSDLGHSVKVTRTDANYVICAELAGDFHLGYARQLTDKSSLL
ncbi:hypothetical protein Q4572_19620, partial [Acinetobacter guillouiae]|nr:hypothetical protein [Acinetobacter guillouiae]